MFRLMIQDGIESDKVNEKVNLLFGLLK